MTEKPALRPIDFQPITYQGQRMWHLRDPLQLSDQQLVMPHTLAQLLPFCDGTRTVDELHQAFCEHIGQWTEREIITDTLAQLDDVFLLENGRSRAAIDRVRVDYRQQPFRPPALASHSYPDTAEALAMQLNEYGAADDLTTWEPWRGRGIIAPHIDYQRGGPVYAKVWQRAKTAVLEADLVLIFGTDHNGGPGTFTLTPLPYATPYGVLPTDTDLIDKLAAAIGPEVAFAEELHHRKEHSIELAAVWLHHLYHEAGVAPKPMVPILVGSFHQFVQNGRSPLEDPTLATALEVLRAETAVRRVFSVASVDFAHVGPAFGDSFLMDEQRRTALRQTDDYLAQAIVRGDAAAFYNQIAAVENKNRVCGFSPIYLLMQYLGSTEGVQVAYDQCPADEKNTSLVSIAGILLE